jgi:SAM-dependent methyltransferase
MTTFDQYAEYYDLLYREKDYESETAFVLDAFTKYTQETLTSVLDMGCGTGKHASFFAKEGCRVHGVDLSDKMITIARTNFADSKNIQFCVADVRSFRAPIKFDFAYSLFHVASYQVTNDDIKSYLKTAYDALRDGGIFAFDFWYGPGVLNLKAETRVKRLNNDKVEVIRIAEPRHDTFNSRIDVNYTIWMKAPSDDKWGAISEYHPMRYFFPAEIKEFAESVGFSKVNDTDFYSWMGQGQPIESDWASMVVLRKR